MSLDKFVGVKTSTYNSSSNLCASFLTHVRSGRLPHFYDETLSALPPSLARLPT